VQLLDYVKQSSLAAGENHSFNQKAAGYCANISDRLRPDPARTATLHACRRIVRSDGELRPVEQALIRKLRATLGDKE